MLIVYHSKRLLNLSEWCNYPHRVLVLRYWLWALSWRPYEALIFWFFFFTVFKKILQRFQSIRLYSTWCIMSKVSAWKWTSPNGMSLWSWFCFFKCDFSQSERLFEKPFFHDIDNHFLFRKILDIVWFLLGLFSKFCIHFMLSNSIFPT